MWRAPSILMTTDEIRRRVGLERTTWSAVCFEFQMLPLRYGASAELLVPVQPRPSVGGRPDDSGSGCEKRLG